MTRMTLAPQTIHLWHINLEADEPTVRAYCDCLSSDEIARANKFHFPIHANRYIVARGAVRSILARYLDTTPDSLHFTYNKNGKPALEPDPTQITFNISHSGNRAVLAITQQSRIGVDIEAIEPKRDLAEIAEKHFAPPEAALVTSLRDEARTQAFYTCWTAKEAYLKAIGTGLQTPLDSFEFVFPPAAPTSLLRIDGSPNGHLGWQTFAFIQDSFAIAIVVEGKDHAVRHMTWHPRSEAVTIP